MTDTDGRGRRTWFTDDPAALVGRFLECAELEAFHRRLIDRDDTSRATRRLRDVLTERQVGWVQAASGLAAALDPSGRGADEDALWDLVERWAFRARLPFAGEQAAVWVTVAGALAVCLVLRGREDDDNARRDEDAT